MRLRAPGRAERGVDCASPAAKTARARRGDAIDIVARLSEHVHEYNQQLRIAHMCRRPDFGLPAGPVTHLDESGGTMNKQTTGDAGIERRDGGDADPGSAASGLSRRDLLKAAGGAVIALSPPFVVP